jgi:MYXO-CTERM domain-containing protein
MKTALRKSAVLAATLCALCAGARADDVKVYVGYADNLRASGFFPTTWVGDANVVSQTPSGQSLDAGAVRIDNTSSSAITISNFNVFLPSGGNFSIWSTLVIPAGMTGIFTQTGSYNFDSSDYGIFGALPPPALAPNSASNPNLIGGCSSSAAVIAAAGYTSQCAASNPVITFMANSTAESFTDSGQILNTGGWDFVFNSNYGEDGNESINWNLVGTGAVRGGTPPIPEPGNTPLFALGLAGLAMQFALRRRRS